MTCHICMIWVQSLNFEIDFSFIADEELGGHDGMAKYCVSKEFKDLNIGFALDEGLASEENAIPLFYGERNVFWVQFKCHGTYNIFRF